LDSIDDVDVVAVCDRDNDRLERVRGRVPNAALLHDAEDVLDTLTCDAVVIATPTRTHYALAKRALEQGLHVFVEKPLATNVEECHELIELARERNLRLFVGHVFLYSAPVAKLKSLVSSGDLGDICYIAASRLNLGPVRQDVNALWDLAPHDVSIMLDLIESKPTSVSCTGLAHLNPSIHDVCSVSIDFEHQQMGIIHLSWLDPRKKREMTVVGSKKMAVYNDLEPLEKVKVYDIGVEAPDDADSFGEFQFTYRYGDTYAPRIKEHEPLKVECQAFIDAVVNEETPKTDGWNGLEVVSVIEAAQKSLLSEGERVEIKPESHRVSVVANVGLRTVNH
jgi:predicted dehydrogenase